VHSIKNIIRQENQQSDLQKKTITQITIYKETDPAKVLLMGEDFEGSCLGFYAML